MSRWGGCDCEGITELTGTRYFFGMKKDDTSNHQTVHVHWIGHQGKERLMMIPHDSESWASVINQLWNRG